MKAVDYLFLVALMFVGLGAMDVVSHLATGLAWVSLIVLLVYKVFVCHIAPCKDQQ